MTMYVMRTHGQSGPMTIMREALVFDVHSPKICTLPSDL